MTQAEPNAYQLMILWSLNLQEAISIPRVDQHFISWFGATVDEFTGHETIFDVAPGLHRHPVEQHATLKAGPA